MKPLRVHRKLGALVLLWFALALAATLVSPIVKPISLQWVCSGVGIQLKQSFGGDGDENVARAAHGMDCPLCQMVPTLPPPQGLVTERLPTDRSLPDLTRSLIVLSTTPPLPSRGPPLAPSPAA